MSVWQATLTLNPYNILTSTRILLVLIKRQSVCVREIESVCVHFNIESIHSHTASTYSLATSAHL